MKERKISLVGPYKEPQNTVFNGVMTMDRAVDTADMLMESGVLPFARCVRKFDRFPPGAAATRNMPSAMLGCG